MSYTEGEKLKVFDIEAGAIRDFIEWLMADDIGLCKFNPNLNFNNYQPVEKSFEHLLMEFLEIDPKKLEEERQAMILQLQEDNA